MIRFSRLDHSGWWPWTSKPATGPIKFYNRDDPYYEFTNFYSAPIEVDRKTWPTTEHYFQAQKFVGTPYEEQIRHLPRPRQAFDFTRDPRVSRWRRNDWESIKEHVMYKALLAKFTQHSYLRKLLLGTGERDLIEHSPYDSYWGDGGDDTGKNRLGKLLMELRRELRSGKKGKKSASILPHLQRIEQEVTKENLQHSSRSGQGLGHSGGTPPSSEHGGYTSDSHLVRRPLQEQSSYPDDPTMIHQPTNCSTDKSSLGHQHPTGYMPAPNLLQSTAPCAEHTMEQLQPPSTVPEGLQASSPLVGVTRTSYQTFPAHSAPAAPANSQHRPVTQPEGDLATGEVSMDYTEQGMFSCNINLSQSSALVFDCFSIPYSNWNQERPGSEANWPAPFKVTISQLLQGLDFYREAT